MSVIDYLAVPSPKCVGTQKVARKCRACEVDLQPYSFGRPRSYCEACNDQRHASRDGGAALRTKLRNLVYAYRNRDRAFTFDGRYEGTTTDPITVVYGRVKDTGYVAMPIDVHIEPRKAGFQFVTPEDVAWAEKQKRFRHSEPMPRALTNFCPRCAEITIHAGGCCTIQIGMYLPIAHKCPAARVFDGNHNLLEEKAL